MAGVNTSVSVRDNMSAAFMNIASAIDVCLGSYIELQAATNESFDTQQIEAARGAMLDLNTAAAQLENEIEQAEQEQKQFNTTASQGTTAMDGMLNKVLGIVGAYASWRALGAVTETADELTNATARIDMMNDGLRSTEEVMQSIYQAAEEARGSYTAMASVVAKLGNNAGDAFGNNTEQIIEFAELVQKQFVIAGASATEASNAMLQLTQGLGSGVLRGDELNSIFEQAPNLIRTIADYMGVSVGQIRELASEGQITAEIVKNAMFDASDEINEKFESMPVTWAQVGQSISNQALVTFDPLLDMISEITQMEEFATVVEGITLGFEGLAAVAMPIVQGLIEGGAWVVENWSDIAPVVTVVATSIGVLTVAMTVYQGVQWATNAALYACPLTWIVLAIMAAVAAIYLLIGAWNQLTGETNSATGAIVGVISAGVAIVWNLAYGVFAFVVGIIVELYNVFAAFANFFANVFNDPVGAVINLFMALFDVVLGVVESCAQMIDIVFGSNLAGSLQEFRNNMMDATAMIVGEQTVVMERADQEEVLARIGLERMDVSDTYDWGYNAGESFETGVENLFTMNGLDELSSEVAALGDYSELTSSNTSAIADSLEITEDNLAWMKDIAEREVIDRTVFRDIKVELGGVNNVVNNMSDLDSVGQYLADSIEEQMANSAEGV